MSRFEVLEDGWVKDMNTGLEWLLNPFDKMMTWEEAIETCQEVGGDLPTIHQLFSIIDHTQYDLALPEGHPFVGLHSAVYWSGSTYADYTALAWGVSLRYGFVSTGGKLSTAYVWPVRGGSHE